MGQEEKTTQWKQWAASIVATMTMLSGGSVFGWPTDVLPRMLDKNSSIHITPDQSSWIVSLTSVGSTIGPVIGAFCGDNLGRKRTLLLTGVTYVIGWVIHIVARRVGDVYVARTILGIAIGMAYTVCPMYVSEIADVNIRGAVGTLTTLNFLIGQVLAGVVGPFVSIEELTMILLLIPIIFLIGFVWFPETPCYLAWKGKHEEGAGSLGFFRGIGRIEAREHLEKVDKDMNDNARCPTWRDKFSEMLLPKNRSGIIIVVVLFTAMLFSGNLTTMEYLDVFFREANVRMNADIASLMVLVVGLLFGIAATVLIERIGRRLLLMISCMGVAINMAVLGTYLYLEESSMDVDFLNWLPIIFVILSQAFYQIGLAVVPEVLLGELFSINVKGIVGAVVISSNSVLEFFVMKLYQVVGDSVGQHINYYFFCVSSLLAFVYVLFVVPETKKRTIKEIQEELTDSRPGCFGRGKFNLH